MEDNNHSDRSATIFLVFVAICFGLYLAGKAFDWFSVWISDPKNVVKSAFMIVVVGIVFSKSVQSKIKNFKEKKKKDQEILGEPDDNHVVGAVYCGESNKKESVWIKPKQRAMHTQIIGTTNAGKTESVILPWAIQDIMQGRGLILIDGKADSTLLNKLWAYVVRYNRQDDFRLFSLSNLEESQQFNPLIGGTPEEIAERVFNAFEFENPYYKSLQYEVFSQVLRVLTAVSITPTFARTYQVISDPRILEVITRDLADKTLRNWVTSFIALTASDRAQRTSGLLAAIGQFSQGNTSCLFNSENPTINLDEALKKNQIVYFQLPVLKSPFLGKAAGKMILQSLQSAVSNRHNDKKKKSRFFSVFLDDFSEYLYPGFVSILNKSRSANVGVVFAHQALGDIKTLGEPIANSILTNANLKIFMRGNDPDSAEYFSRVIGTDKSVKYTERTKVTAFKKTQTGEASAREVDEFTHHPNKFKRELGVGEAIMIVPHASGSKVVEIKFDMFDDLEAEYELERFEKPKCALIETENNEIEFKSA